MLQWTRKVQWFNQNNIGKCKQLSERETCTYLYKVYLKVHQNGIVKTSSVKSSQWIKCEWQ